MTREKNIKLIEVVVNRPLWQSFTYSIPARLAGGNLAGCRVAVPFGTGRLIGYVWGFTTGDRATTLEVKDVLDRLDANPLLPQSILKLVRWAADYYQAPPGMMMAAAHSPGISGKAERVVSLTGKIDPEHPLCSLLPTRRSVSVKLLGDSMNSDYPLEKELSELEKMGILRTIWKPVSGPQPVMERIIEAAATDSTLTRRAEAMKRTAPRQAEILLYMATSEGPVTSRHLTRAAGAAASSLKGLIKKGLLKESYRRRYRESLLRSDIEVEKDIPVLSEPQEHALKAVIDSLDRTEVFLMHGVTGSGKTEVYLRAISEVISRGRTALVLVPEISLTPLTVSRFSRRFPGLVTVLHSGMTGGERLDSWNLAKLGERRIVIGPRSAVFAPLPDLGIIVVDEEHDGSYKQNELPRYNSRDVAVVRGTMEGIPVILGSASPSMESYGNAVNGRYHLLELDSRIDGIPMPSTILVEEGSMHHPLISDELLSGIGRRTANGEQSIILINRRGFSPTQMCRNCGHREQCPNCGVTLTYHRKGQVLRCHYCNHWKAAMVRCPQCGFDEFSHMGPGIQKVAEYLRKLLPETRVIRMDADTTRGKDAHWDILSRFAQGKGDVLLGTQMVAKGHDFPGVTLVGVIAADMGLAFPDFRAAERTFQLILQVAGRAGRGRLPGEVIIQTKDPNSPVIKAAATHDFADFWKRESRVREMFGYPPFGYLVRFVWSGFDKRRVHKAACTSVKGIGQADTSISDVLEAAFPRINRRWRWSVIAKSPSRKSLARISREVRKQFDKVPHKGVRLEIDVDPYHLL
ncbi:MAG: primosomal protein N' [Candidatus Aegiribacteria sp.]|nr:primosomal protein N' [Candidatus Aegiribacteria sp.]